MITKHPELVGDPVGLANVLGLKSIALDALGRRGDGRRTARQALALDRRCKWAMVGLACSVIPFLAPLVGASAMTRLINSLRAS